MSIIFTRKAGKQNKRSNNLMLSYSFPAHLESGHAFKFSINYNWLVAFVNRKITNITLYKIVVINLTIIKN